MWRTVRVFISSTFRDMHGERDLLTRFVFPELRARAHSRCIQIYEVDLRWGVTEEDSRSARALEICLGEISRSQYFVGMLGQRYGWVQDEYMAPDLEEYDWIREYPSRRSITELEMYHAALADPEKAMKKAFFFFRDKAFLSEVPSEQIGSFSSNSYEEECKIEALKSEIRESGLEVHDRYPARWFGVAEGKPMTGGLEDFGQRVLNVLWNRIQKDYPLDDPNRDAMVVADNLHMATMESLSEKFVGRRELLQQAMEVLQSNKHRIVVGCGKPGSGKSAFMAALAQLYLESLAVKKTELIIPHFVGAAPNSANIAAILTRLCHEMKRRFRVKLDIPDNYADLVLEWPEFLASSATNVGPGTQLVILIDGLDLLENKHGAMSMEWLPGEADIPTNVVIMLSCREGQPAHSILTRRQPSPHQIVIGALNIFDKAEMVRRSLAKHRKALDESAFGNQMKLLLTKKEANNPLYLFLACEELRMFGVYEKVSARIRAMSPTISGLLQEILARLEGEHGKELVTAAMALIALANNGLQEAELSALLAMHQSTPATGAMTGTGTQYKLPPAMIARLFRSIQNYLQSTNQEKSDLLVFSHQDVRKAVYDRYMKGAQNQLEKQLHGLLVSYFKSEADPANDGSYAGRNPRAFAELTHHMYMAGMWKELGEALTNIHYVLTKCRVGLANQLLEDYTPNMTELSTATKVKEIQKLMQLPKMQEFRFFVSRNLHILSTNPSLVLQQAINEPSTSLLSQEATQVVSKQDPSTHNSLIYWTNKPATFSSCYLTVTSNMEAINCVAVSRDQELLACGSSDCTVKVFDIRTGHEIGTFIGHAGPITGVCFVGKQLLCSASQDSRLSLWDVKAGHRVEVMSGHSRAVQHCAANRTGKLIVSVGLDCSVKVWKGDSGKLQATMRTPGFDNKPINCVAFHPEGQLIAVGGWDTHVKIWDTYNTKRLKVLKGHNTSVQACSYAPSGLYIASASLDGEVRLWSAKSGTTIGILLGHAQLVNGVAFSSDGKLLATGSDDRTVKLWTSTLGTPVRIEGSLSGDLDPVLCLDCHEGKQQVLVGHQSGAVKLFDLKTKKTTALKSPHGAIPITTVSWGPDNADYCFTGAADNSAMVWAVGKNNKMVSLEGHTRPVRCSVWDTYICASGSEDMIVRIWPHLASHYDKNVKSKDPVQPTATLIAHTGPVNSLSVSSNKMYLASASTDMSVILWDAMSYKKVHVIDGCHKDWVTTCCFSDTHPDLLLTGSNDFTLKLWDVKSLAAEKTTFTGHVTAVTHAAFQKGCIVSASSDGSVKVWTHKAVELTTMRCHRGRIGGCALYLPQRGGEKSVSWADIADEEEEDANAKKRQAFDLKDTIVITGGADGLVGFWRPFIPHQLQSLSGHAGPIKTLALTDQNHIVSASADRTIKLWNPTIDEHALTKVNTSPSDLAYHSGAVVSVDISSDGRFAATGGRDGLLKIWSIKIDESATASSSLFAVLHETAVSEQSKPLGAVCFTDQETVAAASYSGQLTLWKFSEQEPLTKTYNYQLQEKMPITSLALSGDKKCLLAGSVSGYVTTILLSTRREFYYRSLHTNYVSAVVGLTSDKLVSAGLDSRVVFWQPSHKQGVKLVDMFEDTKETDNGNRWITGMTVIGEMLFVGDSLGFVVARKVSNDGLEEQQSSSFRVESGKLLLEKKLHAKGILAVASLSGGTQDLLLTGSEDCCIKLWRVSSRNHEVNLWQVGQFHCSSPVTSLVATVTAGNKLIVAGDTLGKVYLLNCN